MEAGPIISIILPTRNRLGTIQRTVERILAQTFSDWELVISDNASDEPGKGAWLEGLAARESRVVLHFQESNIGIHANWRFCIERTRGRYYIPVTDDDWWQEDVFLETLLSLHDGSTASVFPNLSIHQIDTGEVLKGVLDEVFVDASKPHEYCERILRDEKGAVMVGLIDLDVVPKAEVVSVIDNDLVYHIETVGMNRIARKYRIRYCGSVNYCHSSYSENYCLGFRQEQLLEDLGIVTFRLLDDYRREARANPEFETAFQIQREKALSFCRQTANVPTVSGERGELVKRLRNQLGQRKEEISAMRRNVSTPWGALRTWWRLRSGNRKSLPK